MKNLLLILGLAGLMFTANAQEQVEPQEEQKDKKLTTDQTYVEKEAKIEKYHNQAELEKMGKIELTNLYIERVKVLSEVLPYIALSKDPAGAKLEDLGIPETKPNIDDLEK